MFVKATGCNTSLPKLCYHKSKKIDFYLIINISKKVDKKCILKNEGTVSHKKK